MDTVLGLSLTSTTVSWALVDGADIDGATLAGKEFGIPHNGGFGAVFDVLARVAAVVSHVQAMVQTQGLRLRGIGVTWSGDVAADAALVLESLTEAGFDNVAPIRFSRAAESLTGGIGPIVGSEQAAVCVIEPNRATVVMLAGRGDDAPAVAECSIDRPDDVIGWLTGIFASDGWRPGVLVVAGAGAGLDKLGRRLDARLSVPVFVQAGAQLALARGAALVLGPYAEFAGAPLDGRPGGLDLGPVRTRPLSYTGALTMLVGGMLTFVVSVSAALSLQLGPGKSSEPAGPVANASAPPTVVRVVAPAQPPLKAPEPSAELPAAPTAFGALLEGAPAEAAGPMPLPPNRPRSLLNRVLGHMPHLPGH